MNEPATITDITGMEWILPIKPRYYVHQFKPNAHTKPTEWFVGKWTVIDSESDTCVTGCKNTKAEAVNAFIKCIDIYP